MDLHVGYWSLFFAQRGSKSVFKVLFLGKSNHMEYCKKWNYCNSLNILNCLIMLFGWGRWGNLDNFCLISTNKLAQRTRFKICFRCSLISHWWVEHNYYNIPSWISTLIVLMLPSLDLANTPFRSSFAEKKIVQVKSLPYYFQFEWTPECRQICGHP